MKRTRTLTVLVALGLLSSSPALAELPHEERSAQKMEQAKSFFQSGISLITAETANFQDAYPLFKKAYALSGNSWKVLGNLGYCALNLERDAEAIEHYTTYLEQGGSEIDPEERKHIERDLVMLKAQLTSLSIESDVKLRYVTVKREGSQAPTQRYNIEGKTGALRLRAGTHTIVAHSESETREISALLTAGEETDRTFVFEEEEQEVAPPSTEPAPSPVFAAVEPVSHSPALRIASYSALGLGIVGLGVGSYFQVSANSYASDYREFSTSCVAGGCSSSEVNQGVGDYETGNDHATYGMIGFVAGGTLAAAGVAGLLIDSVMRSTSETVRNVRFQPVVAPGGAGAAISAQF